MAKRIKKPKINLNELNPDDVAKETVALYIMGRTLARLGAIITNREKSDGEILYSLIKADRKPSEKLPVIVNISEQKRDNLKRYTPTEAIRIFTEKYPKAAQPLSKLLEERCSQTSPVLNYGLKEGGEIDDDYMISLLEKTLPLRRSHARILYEKIIKPEYERQKEEAGLASVVIKE